MHSGCFRLGAGLQEAPVAAVFANGLARQRVEARELGDRYPTAAMPIPQLADAQNVGVTCLCAEVATAELALLWLLERPIKPRTKAEAETEVPHHPWPRRRVHSFAALTHAAAFVSGSE